MKKGWIPIGVQPFSVSFVVVGEVGILNVFFIEAHSIVPSLARLLLESEHIGGTFNSGFKRQTVFHTDFSRLKRGVLVCSDVGEHPSVFAQAVNQFLHRCAVPLGGVVFIAVGDDCYKREFGISVD